MQESLTTRLSEDKHELLRILDLITEDRWEQETQAGKWTFRQLSEHIFRTNVAVMNLILGQKKPTEEEEVKNLDSFMNKVFTQDDQFYPAPPVVAPQPTSIPKAELRQSLEQTYDTLTQLSNRPDLDQECMGFAHPNFGKLTGNQWLQFIHHHNRRHFRQLERAL